MCSESLITNWLLCFQLAADPDPNVKNGAELLDRLIKVSHYQQKLKNELTDQLGSRDHRFWMMILIWATWGWSVCILQMMWANIYKWWQSVAQTFGPFQTMVKTTALRGIVRESTYKSIVIMNSKFVIWLCHMMEPSQLHLLPICRCMFMCCIVQFQDISILPPSQKSDCDFLEGGGGILETQKMFETGIPRWVGRGFFEIENLFRGSTCIDSFWNYTFWFG